ncbi:hypothetical protein FVE85_4223 [Porphyridium purpureum]|uniref:Glycosyltransferase family 92 protein n=1 Tax=Porphyridium purpureum TaxID=35688 RepID=A0A5J4YSJ1_PORPP|nr:hypothetical protein FVE85_4223 [Porphyridium purpureum]|eukprot:POR7763..scf229_5
MRPDGRGRQIAETCDASAMLGTRTVSSRCLGRVPRSRSSCVCRSWMVLVPISFIVSLCAQNVKSDFAPRHEDVPSRSYSEGQRLARLGAGEMTTEEEEGLWLKAYALPYSTERVPPSTGVDPEGFVVAIVSYRLEYVFTNATAHIQELQDACVIDNMLESQTVWIKMNFKEERGRWGAAVVLCFFDLGRVEKHFQSAVKSQHAIRFLDIRTEFARTLRPYKPRGLTVCVPTLFGAQFVHQMHRFRSYVAQYAQYYQEVHGMDHLFVYSDSEVLSLAVRGAHPRLETIFLDGWNGKSHYHGQRLAQLDCWLKAMHLNSEWVLFVDLDEVLTWPFEDMSWNEVFGHFAQAISFGSERVFSTNNDSLESVVSQLAHPVQVMDNELAADHSLTFYLANMKRVSSLWMEKHALFRATGSSQLSITALDALYKNRSTESIIESCKRSFFNGRKFAMRCNVWNGFWPASVHEVEQIPRGPYRAAMCDTDSSGVFLKHFTIAKAFSKLLLKKAADIADDPDTLKRVVFSSRVAHNIPLWTRAILDAFPRANASILSTRSNHESGELMRQQSPGHPLDRFIEREKKKRRDNCSVQSSALSRYEVDTGAARAGTL